MINPRVIYDCFVRRDDVEHICEVYSASDGYVEDFAVYPLLDGGKKGDCVDGDHFEQEVNEKYYEWITSGHETDVI